MLDAIRQSRRVYRARTALRSLWALYRLDSQTVDAFMNAYALFDGDWSNDNGKDEGQIVDYYRVLNHLCTLGNVEKMYIPPVLDSSVGVTANQVLFEKKMTNDLSLRPDQHVLDVGCGRGRIAAHISQLTGARVSGINIDPSQIENAEANAKRSGLEGRCTFVRSSLNDPLPFPDETFDGVYQVQAFTYARDREKVFRELYRVMRPGATFSFLDWITLPSYDRANPEHVTLMQKTRGIIGGVDAPTADQVEIELKNAGFDVTFSGNISKDGLQSTLIKAEDRYFRAARMVVDFLAKVRILPAHFPVLFERFVKDADAFVTSDELGLSTTSYQIIAKKRSRSPAYASEQAKA